VFEFWKIYKGRTAAIASLQPFVDHTLSQLPVNINANWQNPHILGFMATIVTLITEHVVGSLKSDSIASVQSGALAHLTKAGSELIGEQIYLLSSMNDIEFQIGCKNGQVFFEQIDFNTYNTFNMFFNAIILDPIDLAKTYYSNPLVQELNQELLDLWVANVDDKFMH
jgi:hypothetical protein